MTLIARRLVVAKGFFRRRGRSLVNRNSSRSDRRGSLRSPTPTTSIGEFGQDMTSAVQRKVQINFSSVFSLPVLRRVFSVTRQRAFRPSKRPAFLDSGISAADK